eukprot:SRR837773.6161.p1 GENE.SRR837773.6161~~SRR837773.6161.p1  ORF type:complete len:387 (+),score=207.41 SRR837773.6161:35-1162(+)
MAPAKRAAAGRPAKSPKKAKVSAAPEPKFAVLEELKRGGVTESCLEMLAAALPHALETPKEDRHQFQTSVIDNLLDLSAKEQASREEALKKAEDELANHDAEKAAMEAKAEAAAAEELARREKKEAAEGRVKTVTGAAEAAEQALEEVKSKAEGAQAKVEAATSEKETFVAKVAEQWPPLRDATFEKKDWRLRQKAITQVMHLFKPIAPDSMTASLPLVLKESLADRGEFGKLVVQEGERMLNAHAEALEAAIGAAKAAQAGAGEEVARAEGMVKDAHTARDQTMAECVAIENEWLEAEEASAGITNFIKRADGIREEREAAVQAAKASVEALEKAVAEFKNLLEPPPAAEVAPEVPAEEPAAAMEAVVEEAVAA